MAEFGIVQKIDGQYAELLLTRTEACKHCNACLPSLTGKQMILRAENRCGAKAGDTVRVSVTQSGFLSAVLILYVIPAFVFLLAIVIGSLLACSEWLSMGLGAAGLAISYLIIHRLEKKLRQDRYIPVAEAILETPDAPDDPGDRQQL